MAVAAAQVTQLPDELPERHENALAIRALVRVAAQPCAFLRVEIAVDPLGHVGERPPVVAAKADAVHEAGHGPTTRLPHGTVSEHRLNRGRPSPGLTLRGDADVDNDTRCRDEQGGGGMSARIAAVAGVVAVLLGGLWLVAGVLAPSYTTSLVAGVSWCVIAIMVMNRLARPTRVRTAVRVATSVAALTLVAGFWWTSVRDTRVSETVAVGVPASQTPEGVTSGAESARAPRLRPGRRARKVDAGRGRNAGDPASGRQTTARQRESQRARAARAERPAPPRTEQRRPRRPEGRTPAAPEAASSPAATNVQLLDGPVQALSHSASGRAAVVELAARGRVLTLSDFEIDPGPDVRVYLAAGDPRTDGEVDDFVSLGRLKGNVGDQQYAIPDALDVERYDTVIFWCVPFTNAIARAPLSAS